MTPLAKLAAAAGLVILSASAPLDSVPRDPLPLDPVDVDFATLSAFEFAPGMELPKSVTRYDGQTISISGFMATEDGSAGPTDEFLLINDACGCEGTPKINEVIFCMTADGSRVDIDPGVVTVTGTLDVGEVLDYGVVVSLYRLDVTKIDT